MQKFDSFEALEMHLENLLNTIDMTPLFKQIEQLILSSIAINFKEGGRYGSGKFGGGTSNWTKSKRAIAQSGQTLQDTGSMKQNIGVQVSYSNGQFEVTLTAGKIYSAAHNFGHPSKPKLPARPFLVIQDEDLEDIQNLFAEHLAKYI